MGSYLEPILMTSSTEVHAVVLLTLGVVFLLNSFVVGWFVLYCALAVALPYICGWLEPEAPLSEEAA